MLVSLLFSLSKTLPADANAVAGGGRMSEPKVISVPLM